MPWRGLVFPGVFSVRLLALPGTDLGQAYGPVVAHQRGCAQPAVKRVSGESSAFASTAGVVLLWTEMVSSRPSLLDK